MNLDFSLILTCTIDPKDMPDLVRSNKETRLNDYKKSFNFWINNSYIKKIIFIENSSFDLTYFKNLAKNFKDKEIEIMSSNSNNTFDKISNYFEADYYTIYIGVVWKVNTNKNNFLLARE